MQAAQGRGSLKRGEGGPWEGSVHGGPRRPPPQGLVLELERFLAQHANEWTFDAFKLNELSGGHPLSTLGFYLLHQTGLLMANGIRGVKAARFLRALEDGYRPNAYHNVQHATDVLQTMHVLLLRTGMVPGYADPSMHLACLLAAAVHDLDHTGLTNDMLTSTDHQLAIIYNDRSPQENHHLASCFRLLQQPHLNLFSHMPRPKRMKLRKVMIELVLATDMSKHMSILTQFNTVHRLTPAGKPVVALAAPVSTLTPASAADGPGSLPASAASASSPLGAPIAAPGSAAAAAKLTIAPTRSTREGALAPATPGASLDLRHIPSRASTMERQPSLPSAIAKAPLLLGTGSARSLQPPLWQPGGVSPGASGDVQDISVSLRGLLTRATAANGSSAGPPALSASHTQGGQAGGAAAKQPSPEPVAGAEAGTPARQGSGVNRPSSGGAQGLVPGGDPEQGAGLWVGLRPELAPAVLPAPLDEAEQLLSLQIALKCADIGLIAEGLETNIRWVNCLEAEFFAQGDQEKAAGLTVSALMDRDKPGVSKSQTAFYDFIGTPMFTSFVQVFPGARPMLDQLHSNYKYWQAKFPPTTPSMAPGASTAPTSASSTAAAALGPTAGPAQGGGTLPAPVVPGALGAAAALAVGSLSRAAGRAVVPGNVAAAPIPIPTRLDSLVTRGSSTAASGSSPPLPAGTSPGVPPFLSAGSGASVASSTPSLKPGLAVGGEAHASGTQQAAEPVLLLPGRSMALLADDEAGSTPGSPLGSPGASHGRAAPSFAAGIPPLYLGGAVTGESGLTSRSGTGPGT